MNLYYKKKSRLLPSSMKLQPIRSQVLSHTGEYSRKPSGDEDASLEDLLANMLILSH